MKTPHGILPAALVALTAIAAAPPADPKGETLVSPAGVRTPGRLEGDAKGGFRFTAGAEGSKPLERGDTVECPGRGLPPASGLPPFCVEMGLGQRLSGRLVSADDREVRLAEMNGDGRLRCARGGVVAVVQRPGESVVFQDDFEVIEDARWAAVGEPDVVDDPKVAGASSLSLPAGGASLTHRLRSPFVSGRLDLAFYDKRAVVPGHQWFLDLTFRGQSGTQTVRVVLGWNEESLAVESSPGSPALAVQRLARKTGWHRLGVRFGPEACEVGVDGNELAHGKGFGGPLVEIRLATFQAGKTEPPEGLAGYIDDLRLVRFESPAADVETDASQDEVRLTGGDQLFGKVRGAGPERVELTIDGRDVSLPWGEVCGLWFRREAAQGDAIEGLLVRVDWRASSGADPRDQNSVEGALTGLTATELTVATAYAGTLVIPRDRLTVLRVVGRGRRVVIDATAHHLGDEISTTEPILDPPQPEGGVLERAFELSAAPEDPAFLVIDVVQVVGEATELQFSNLVKKGELRTNVKLNGEPFDYLNRHITSKNEAPERIRLPIPRGLLKPGRNVVRFEQTGIASDPNYLDDLGVLGFAVEFPTGPPPR